ATRSRMGIAQSLLGEEMDRSRRIAASESALSELTRDYEVNREIYQDLLRRRENARVSMGLDQENRGLTLRIQDPATVPLRPSGLRFMHIGAAGFAFAVALPLVLLFLLARFDPRVRSARQIPLKTGFPLLTTIPAYPTPRERRRQSLKLVMSVAAVIGVFVVYGLVFAFKLASALPSMQSQRQELPMNDHANEIRSISTAPKSRSIARASESQALSTQGLEERRLIRRNDSARIQADAFRDLRTRLL